jgi:hypothetical protein
MKADLTQNDASLQSAIDQLKTDLICQIDQLKADQDSQSKLKNPLNGLVNYWPVKNG